jgi:hypothetical protein
MRMEWNFDNSWLEITLLWYGKLTWIKTLYVNDEGRNPSPVGRRIVELWKAW